MSARSILAGAALAIGSSWASSLSCPSDAPLSCQNTTSYEDTCCFNAPGGQILLTQFWDTSPSTGPADSWTIHGLWPDNCDGTWEQFCDPSREYTNLTALLAQNAPCTLRYMETFWKDGAGDDESFWEHEFNKHGTCMSTLEPACYADYETGSEAVDYFKRTVSLFKTLPSYTWLEAAGIVPSETVTYSLAEVEGALAERHGRDVVVNCNKDGELSEIWYHFNVRGSVQAGEFVPAVPVGSPSSCPGTGIKYLPKYRDAQPSSISSSSTSSSAVIPSTLSSVVSTSLSVVPSVSTTSSLPSTSSAATTTAPSTTLSPTAAPSPLSGRGRFYASAPNTGFLITAGTWYRAGGTPATYTATPNADGTFKLTTSRGRCAVQPDAMVLCDSSVAAADAADFGFDGTYLTYGGEGRFYADEVPTGTTQGRIFTAPKAVAVQFTWTAL